MPRHPPCPSGNLFPENIAVRHSVDPRIMQMEHVQKVVTKSRLSGGSRGRRTDGGADELDLRGAGSIALSTAAGPRVILQVYYLRRHDLSSESRGSWPPCVGWVPRAPGLKCLRRRVWLICEVYNGILRGALRRPSKIKAVSGISGGWRR